MNDIFILNPETQRVVIDPPILLIEPYKEIWERDKTEKKYKAYDDFTFIHFMTSPLKSNPFLELNGEEKAASINKDVFNNNYKNYKDEKVLKAIELREKWLWDNSFTYSFYKNGIELAKKLRDNLKTINPNETTNNGSLRLKPADIMRALKELPDTIEQLKKQSLTVFEEYKVAKRNTNNKQINHFEK